MATDLFARKEMHAPLVDELRLTAPQDRPHRVARDVELPADLLDRPIAHATRAAHPRDPCPRASSPATPSRTTRTGAAVHARRGSIFVAGPRPHGVNIARRSPPARPAGGAEADDACRANEERSDPQRRSRFPYPGAADPGARACGQGPSRPWAEVNRRCRRNRRAGQGPTPAAADPACAGLSAVPRASRD